MSFVNQPTSTDNFTLEQQEEEGELGTNMAAPVGAPSSITPYFPLSSIDINSTRQWRTHFAESLMETNQIFDFKETKVSEWAYFDPPMKHLHRRVGKRVRGVLVACFVLCFVSVAPRSVCAPISVFCFNWTSGRLAGTPTPSSSSFLPSSGVWFTVFVFLFMYPSL